ncbi:MAG: glycosyltransferase [Prevotella sp.]|nr:glycosyltransferase [Prevotella sp.]
MSTQSHHIQYDKIRKTSSKDLVSVVMPMHNAAKFIGEAIESVIAQTYEEWELLIVDDNSKDNSMEIAQEYAEKNPRIHVLSNDRPIGMPSAPRNVGIKAAKGRFIAFLDSDDLWFPQKLEQQIALFKDNRTAIVFANYEKIDEEGNRANRFIIAPPTATYRTLLYGNVIGNLTGIYDTQKVGKVIIQDIHHEDYVMWLHILRKGYIAQNTNTTLAAYRVCGQSVSANKLKVIGWQWNIYRKVEHLNFIPSVFYLMSYAYKAFAKSIV